jgi:hypothetical protein
MATMFMKDMIAVTESVGEWRERNGVVETNHNGRPTTRSLKSGSDGQFPFGYLAKLGSKNAIKTISAKQVLTALKHAEDKTLITEIYPTRFCVHCKRPSWNFIRYPHKGHSTCKSCGTVNKIHEDNVGSLHLNDDGRANFNKLNFTQGMTHNDTETRKSGKRIPAPGTRVKSHKRNFWRILKKIEDIAQPWNFGAIEVIIRRAKAKLTKVYHQVHTRQTVVDKDDKEKMPHGGAAMAAACFYASILEFEEVSGAKTLCTLPAIQESAQGARDHKSGRMTRDVTDLKILKYTTMLSERGLCSAKVPHIGAETLRFHPKSSALEHSRMAIFNVCTPTRFHLPARGPWGITVEDSKKGVLQIKSAKTSGKAFAAGIRKGDYIFQVNREVANYALNPTSFQRWVALMKKQDPSKPMMELTIMRKKKYTL